MNTIKTAAAASHSRPETSVRAGASLNTPNAPPGPLMAAMRAASPIQDHALDLPTSHAPHRVARVPRGPYATRRLEVAADHHTRRVPVPDADQVHRRESIDPMA